MYDPNTCGIISMSNQDRCAQFGDQTSCMSSSNNVDIDSCNGLPGDFGICDRCQDYDGDGVCNSNDNCRSDYNPSQTNSDGDIDGAACDCNDGNSALNSLTSWYLNADGDGYYASAINQC